MADYLNKAACGTQRRPDEQLSPVVIVSGRGERPRPRR